MQLRILEYRKCGFWNNANVGFGITQMWVLERAGANKTRNYYRYWSSIFGALSATGVAIMQMRILKYRKCGFWNNANVGFGISQLRVLE